MLLRSLILALVALWLPFAPQTQAMSLLPSPALLGAKQQADAWSERGQYHKAIPYAKRALELSEAELGPEHPETAILLIKLAELYRLQREYTEAVELATRAVKIRENIFGTAHPALAASLFNLAEIYRAHGKAPAAEPLYEQALKIQEKALGPEHLEFAHTLRGLAGVHAIRRDVQAEPLYQQVLQIQEKRLGPEHPDVAKTLSDLGEFYVTQDRFAEAEAPFRHASAIWEKHLGSEHRYVILTALNLAKVLFLQSKIAEARLIFDRALDIYQKKHSQREKLEGFQKLSSQWEDLENLLKLGSQQENLEDFVQSVMAEDYMQMLMRLGEVSTLESMGMVAWKIFRPVYDRFFGLSEDAQQASSDQSWRAGAVDHISKLMGAMRREPARREMLIAEAFEAGQLGALPGKAAQAMVRMAMRSIMDDGPLAETIRNIDDADVISGHLYERLNRAQQELLELQLLQSRPEEQRKALGGKRNTVREAELKAEVAELRRRIDELERRKEAQEAMLEAQESQLERQIPNYYEYIGPRPLALSEVQGLLGTDEALVAYLIGDHEAFLWVVRPNGATWQRLDIGRGNLLESTANLRRSLDPAKITQMKDIPPFDLSLAHALYHRLFAPAEPFLDEVSHIFVVLDGALQSLPLGILLTAEPNQVAEFTDYGQMAWLAKKYASTVLPSVSSLRALRQFARASTGSRPFVGFGDPALGTMAGTRRLTAETLFIDGAVANASLIRSLQPLPETAIELYAIANSLGAEASQVVLLRSDATEARVRGMDLSDFRIVAFATHGLVAGQFKGLAEPGLILTPPDESTMEDDGFLAASEIVQLKLNADWVILSACNTAASDGTPEAEGLSGLAAAFLHAGSRALLVSHWEVPSEAAVDLTTTMFTEAAAHPKIGRAEALRRAMLKLMANKVNSHYAHPMFWAPFVIVGEGGVAPQQAIQP